MKTLTLDLQNEEKTLEIGKSIAKVLQMHKDFSNIKLILLYGTLGAGKTTFTRGFVSGFKDCEKAEVSSPTFTLINQYPTSPKIFHADMYRLKEMQAEDTFIELPEELDEALEAGNVYSIIEWAEYLDLKSLPFERLDIFLEVGHNNHSLTIKGSFEKIDKLFQEINLNFQA